MYCGETPNIVMLHCQRLNPQERTRMEVQEADGCPEIPYPNCGRFRGRTGFICFVPHSPGISGGKAHDGEGVKALALEPDLIVLDLWLPKISGWGVMLRLKSDERTKHIPVLVVTGDVSVQRGECEALLTKPCAPDELGAEIARRVRGHAAQRPSVPPAS